MKITIHSHGQQFGPYYLEQVKELMAAGAFVSSDMAWHEGLPSWVPLSDLPFLQGAVSSARHPFPPPLPYQPVQSRPAQLSVETSTSALAIAALILSLFSPGITPFPAIICGRLALSEIRKNPSLGGVGIAKAGLMIAYFFVAIYIFWFLIVLGIFIAIGLNSH